MVNAFLNAGKGKEALNRALESILPLSGYEVELMERGEITLDGNEKAFELAKALLGETRFVGLLAEAKGEVLENRKATKSPNHRLMSRIMEALRSS